MFSLESGELRLDASVLILGDFILITLVLQLL